MKEHITNNIYVTCPSDIMIQLKRQELLLGKIMTTVNELASKLEAVNVQLALADVTPIPEAETALDNLNPDVV